MLGTTDGGAAHESIDDEKTPLLARLMRDSRRDRSDLVRGRKDDDMSLLMMLTPSRDSWLERRGAVGGGVWGSPVGGTPKTLRGLLDLFCSELGMGRGASTGHSGRVAAGSVCVTGAGKAMA